MLKRLLTASTAILCLVPHLALAQSLGYGVPFGMSPTNTTLPTAGTGYAANDTITLVCTQPSTYGPFIPFFTSPVIKVLTVSTGAVATYIVQNQGITNGTFSNTAISCTQASTSGSGTGATFTGQLVIVPPAPTNATVYPNLPTLSTCGTSPSVSAGSSSNGGQFTLGTASPTACTVTFASPFATQAYCTVTPASSGGAAITGGYYLSAMSKTAFTLTIGTGTNSLVFDYNCEGN